MPALDLYDKYHVSRNDERLGLSQVVRSEFGARCGLYPGCFVQVTPSFVFPEMIYVDSDSNARRFFNSEIPANLVRERSETRANHTFSFYGQDFHEPVPIGEQSVDLLISQYAGFVSDACTRYLAPSGILIANDSHGDAGIAACSDGYRLVAVVHRRGDRWNIDTRQLTSYFEPKSKSVPANIAELRDHILSLGRGIGYTKTATDYVFQRA